MNGKSGKKSSMLSAEGERLSSSIEAALPGTSTQSGDFVMGGGNTTAHHARGEKERTPSPIGRWKKGGDSHPLIVEKDDRFFVPCEGKGGEVVCEYIVRRNKGGGGCLIQTHER